MPADMFLVPIRIRGEDAPISGDTFDFEPELTSEPRAAEARPVIDCEGFVKLLDAATPKADGDSIPTETLSLNFDYFGVPNTKALPGLPMTGDPTNPNADAPTGRTDGVFTVVLPSVPAVQDDGLLLPY